jgi:hypothetical protein
MLFPVECEDEMRTTVSDVGSYLEKQARQGEPITYAQVIDRFPDLPMLTEAWLSHPLCDIFGQLDAQDHAEGRPFRTAMVYAKELSIPGKGFFDTLSKYRKKSIPKSQQLDVWLAEVNAVKAYYKQC